MRRIIITAILTVICAVGAVTSFAVNDLPNFGEWMKTNEQQFRKPPKHDGPDKYMDKQMKDGKDKHERKDGKGPMDGQNMPHNGQPGQPNGQMPPQGQAPQVGQPAQPNGQVPPQGQPSQPPQQSNGNAPQQQTDQGAPQTTQN